MDDQKSEESHQEFVNRVNRGEILIGVDLAVGRRFLMRTPSVFLKETIGDSLSGERFWVNLLMVLGFLSLLGGIAASIFALKWYSLIAIPLMIVVVCSTSLARNTIGFSVFLMAAAGLSIYLLRGKGAPMILWLVSLPLPHLFLTLMYKLTRNFLKRLVLRNEKAFNILLGTVIFLKRMEEG